jgi:hypothetical protein
MPNNPVSLRAVFQTTPVRRTGSRTFDATPQNRPVLTLFQPHVQDISRNAEFDVSGLPISALITRIEVTPNMATMPSAPIGVNGWVVESVNLSRIETQPVIGTPPGTRVFNDFNGTSPNGTFLVRFIGTSGAWPVLPYTAISAYNNLRFVVHYEYWG